MNYIISNKPDGFHVGYNLVKYRSAFHKSEKRHFKNNGLDIRKNSWASFYYRQLCSLNIDLKQYITQISITLKVIVDS